MYNQKGGLTMKSYGPLTSCCMPQEVRDLITRYGQGDREGSSIWYRRKNNLDKKHQKNKRERRAKRG